MMEALGQYKILEPVEPAGKALADPASGSLGDVFRARDTRVGRTVAITVVADRIVSDPAARERFLRDARAAAAVSHPNIVTLYDVGEDEGRLYLVHEFIQGESLGNVIGGRPLHPRRAVDLASQIAEGLSDAHAADLIHGHLTADNVIVTPKGSAKIAGFGVAGWADANPPSEGSREGSAEDPEACRVDLASLGALLFEMLTARKPAPGAGVPSAINRALPRDIDLIVGRALGKSGGYESAVTLAAELRAVGAMLEVRQEASEAAGVSVGPARRKSSFSKWVILALVVGVLTALALGAIALATGFFNRA